jgi:hypothetical protein
MKKLLKLQRLIAKNLRVIVLGVIVLDILIVVSGVYLYNHFSLCFVK